MASVHVWPYWLLGTLVVGLEEAAFDDFVTGRFAALDSLNAVYGADNVEEFRRGGWLYVTFSRPYNLYVSHPDGTGLWPPWKLAGDS
jgi:hypothetical protein